MNTSILRLSLLCLLSTTAAAWAATPSKVVHLPQTHYLAGLENNAAYVDSVVQSQFKIATYVKANPSAAVFQEGLYEDLSPAVYEQLTRERISMVGAAKLFFPDGFPKLVEALNEGQRRLLFEEGAARTLFYLGELTTVHRSISKMESERIDASIAKYEAKFGLAMGVMATRDPELKKLIFSDRENEVVRLIKEYFVATPGPKTPVALLIYGSKHDFAPYFATDPSIQFERGQGFSAEPDEEPGPPTTAEDQFLITEGPFRDFASFQGDVAEAQIYYGNLSLGTEDVLEKILAEQARLLAYVESLKTLIPASEWQHFRSTRLKTEALAVLDPESLGGMFSLESFQAILAADPELAKAGNAWLAEHQLPLF